MISLTLVKREKVLKLISVRNSLVVFLFCLTLVKREKVLKLPTINYQYATSDSLTLVKREKVLKPDFFSGV